jgi:beta-glucanase (GH16 family)
MEYFGHKPNMIQSTIHYGSPWPNNSYNYKQVFSTDYSTDFHLYTLLWEANHIAFYVDSTLINDLTPASIAPKNWPFDQRFYFILNTAVGGNLTNNTIDDAILPGFMDVDYVRVFAKNTTSGLNNIDIQNAMLYPNPVSSSFKIALTNNENASILISSAVGTTLLKIDKYTSDTSIDLSFASAGIYFVTIKTNEGTAIQKIIKTQ